LINLFKGRLSCEEVTGDGSANHLISASKILRQSAFATVRHKSATALFEPQPFLGHTISSGWQPQFSADSQKPFLADNQFKPPSMSPTFSALPFQEIQTVFV
jgi:hypothetical protein